MKTDRRRNTSSRRPETGTVAGTECKVRPAGGRAARGGIPLVWLLVVLLTVAGCSLLNPSEGTGVPPTSGTTAASSQVPSGTGTTAASASATTAPAITASTSPATSATTSTTRPASATTTASTSPTTAPTATTPATTASTAPTTATTATTARPTTTSAPVNLASLSQDPRGWFYSRPSDASLYKDLRVTVPSDVARLIAPWNAIWQAKPTGQKTVYLTMDEGYEFETNTSEILDIAARKNVHIAFFITGTYLRSQPALVRRMANEGHLVLNHTDTHPNLATLYRDKGADAVLANLAKLATEFRAVTGKDMPRHLRPPEGAYSERLLGLLKQNGYRTVFWSFAYRDWLTDDQPTQAAARKLVLGELHDGSVILLHAVSNTNVAILPQLIDDIRARGYRFGSLLDIP